MFCETTRAQLRPEGRHYGKVQTSLTQRTRQGGMGVGVSVRVGGCGAAAAEPITRRIPSSRDRTVVQP